MHGAELVQCHHGRPEEPEDVNNVPLEAYEHTLEAYEFTYDSGDLRDTMFYYMHAQYHR